MTDNPARDELTRRFKALPPKQQQKAAALLKAVAKKKAEHLARQDKNSPLEYLQTVDCERVQSEVVSLIPQEGGLSNGSNN